MKVVTIMKLYVVNFMVPNEHGTWGRHYKTRELQPRLQKHGYRQDITMF